MENYRYVILICVIIIVMLLCDTYLKGLSMTTGAGPIQDQLEEYRLSVVFAEQHIEIQDMLISDLSFELNDCIKNK